jgi:CRP-like cAMP-binding protein
MTTADPPTSICTPGIDQVCLKRELISKCSIFRTCPPVITVAVVDCLHSAVVTPEEVIIAQGDIGDEMYFVSRGSVLIYINH